MRTVTLSRLRWACYAWLAGATIGAVLVAISAPVAAALLAPPVGGSVVGIRSPTERRVRALHGMAVGALIAVTVLIAIAITWEPNRTEFLSASEFLWLVAYFYVPSAVVLGGIPAYLGRSGGAYRSRRAGERSQPLSREQPFKDGPAATTNTNGSAVDTDAAGGGTADSSSVSQHGFLSGTHSERSPVRPARFIAALIQGSLLTILGSWILVSWGGLAAIAPVGVAVRRFLLGIGLPFAGAALAGQRGAEDVVGGVLGGLSVVGAIFLTILLSLFVEWRSDAAIPVLAEFWLPLLVVGVIPAVCIVGGILGALDPEW